MFRTWGKASIIWATLCIMCSALVATTSHVLSRFEKSCVCTKRTDIILSLLNNIVKHLFISHLYCIRFYKQQRDYLICTGGYARITCKCYTILFKKPEHLTILTFQRWSETETSPLRRPRDNSVGETLFRYRHFIIK